MRKKSKAFVSSEMDEEAELEAKRDQFLQEVIDLHKNRKLLMSKEQELSLIHI